MPQVAAVAIVAVAAAVQTISQVQQARGQADQAEAMAKSEMQAARAEEHADRKRSAQVIAKQQAGAATAGLDVGSGTPLELLMDSAFNAELNALRIRQQGKMRAAYFKNQANSAKAQIPGLIFGGFTKAFSSLYGGGAFSGFGGGGASAGGKP